MPLGVGQEFAGFTIVGRLGAGGMGEVYLAQHPRLPRRDALKVLRAEAPTDTRYRDRFLREADAAAKLWHPHIVGVHDRGECDGRLWISMDFVDGEDAASLLNRCYPAGMPVDLVAAIATAVASALDYSHRQGLLHRDVKPANIVIANADDPAQRRILLTDFGIAREIEDVSGLTETNMTVGTFAYSAPEQLMGGAIDGRADQYALAATTYHLLAGDTLFAGTSPAAVIGNHLHSPPPQLSDSRPDFAALDHVMTAALAKEPSDRFPLCSDFARAFAEQASGAPGPSAPTALAPAPRARPAVAPEPAVLVAAREKTPRFGQPALAGLGVVALVLAGVIGSLLSRGGGDGRDRQAGPAATAEQPGTAARDSRPGTVTETETATRTVARPPDTVTLAPTPVRPSPQNGRGEGDLGLAVPISSPPCDGLGVVIVYSATNPKSYGRAVQLALNAHPGASYLRTDQSCPSLKKSSGGEAIYAVYIPAGYSKSSVCAVVRQVGGDAYGRWLDTALSPDHEINC